MVEIPASIQSNISAAIHGDSAAMGILFEWFRPRLYSHALRICGNKPIAQDAVQDTFISAFTHLSSLRNEKSFYPWLKKILSNNCYYLLRHEHSSEINETHLPDDFLLRNSINEHFEKICNDQRLYSALRHLSDDLRSCLMLRYFSSYKSYEEISAILGIPIGTVRSRLSAAREKLTAYFRKIEDANDTAIKESLQWSGYYYHQWNNLHGDIKTRNEFFNHLQPSLLIRFTSGMHGKGRKIIENEINNDLKYGSSVLVKNVSSSGNISVIEAENINHPDYLDRCAPSMALVLFRNGDLVESAHIFDSPRL